MTYTQGTPTRFDCLGAKRICAQVYEESFVPRGFGNFTGEVNSNFSCLEGDDSAIWYTFIADRAGELGFKIIPNNSADNFHWGLFNITDKDCRDIFSTPSMLVSCNATNGDSCDGQTGADNSSTSSSQEGICNVIDPNNSSVTSGFNAFVPVEENNIYALMISDVSGASDGFEIDFTLSENIMLVDNRDPAIKLIEPDVGIGCIPNKIFIQFTEYIKCQSISKENFRLTNEKGQSFGLDLDSGSCNLNGEYDRKFVLALLEPLPAGSKYLLEIEPNESLPIVDLCDNFFSPFSFSFEINTDDLSEINLPTDTSTCQSMLTLNVSNTNATSYLWSDGSTSPSLDIREGGLYRVTVSTPCDQVQSSINVAFVDDSNLNFSLGSDTILCTNGPLKLTANLNNSNYIYEWSDGVVGETREVAESGVYTLEVTNECGSTFSSSIKVTYLDLEVSLSPDTTFCNGSSITIDVTHPSATSYLWSNGETTPTIEISETGLYSIEVKNTCETIVDEISITAIECEDCNVYIPNVISIGGNEDNNQFKIEASCKLESFQLKIFNRWGSVVFESQDQMNIWNGAGINNPNLGSGVYVYQLQIHYFDKMDLVSRNIFGDVLVME